MTERITNVPRTAPATRTEVARVERSSGFLGSKAVTEISSRWQREGTFVRSGSHVERAATQTYHRALVDRFG